MPRGPESGWVCGGPVLRAQGTRPPLHRVCTEPSQAPLRPGAFCPHPSSRPGLPAPSREPGTPLREGATARPARPAIPGTGPDLAGFPRRLGSGTHGPFPLRGMQPGLEASHRPEGSAIAPWSCSGASLASCGPSWTAGIAPSGWERLLLGLLCLSRFSPGTCFSGALLQVTRVSCLCVWLNRTEGQRLAQAGSW